MVVKLWKVDTGNPGPVFDAVDPVIGPVPVLGPHLVVSEAFRRVKSDSIYCRTQRDVWGQRSPALLDDQTGGG